MVFDLQQQTDGHKGEVMRFAWNKICWYRFCLGENYDLDLTPFWSLVGQCEHQCWRLGFRTRDVVSAALVGEGYPIWGGAEACSSVVTGSEWEVPPLAFITL